MKPAPGRPELGPAVVGGRRPAALGARLPPRLPADRQRARRRGPHARRLHPRLPLPRLLPPRHLQGLAAPDPDEPLPRPDAPQAWIRFDALSDEAAARLPSRLSGPERHFEETHFDDDVQRALDALAPDFRAAVVLAGIEGLSYEEISEVLDIKLGTGRSRIHRGRAQLRGAWPTVPRRRSVLARPACHRFRTASRRSLAVVGLGRAAR